MNPNVSRCVRMHTCASLLKCVSMPHATSRTCVRTWLALSCSVSQAYDKWLFCLTAEEFITDNYIRMCWKTKKPQTVCNGRCWASAYTVPCAPCALDFHFPPRVSKCEMAEKTETLERPKDSSPFPLPSLAFSYLSDFSQIYYI